MDNKLKMIWKEFFRLKREELKHALFTGPRCLAGFLLIIAISVAIMCIFAGVVFCIGWLHVNMIGWIFSGFVTFKTVNEMYWVIGGSDIVVAGITSLPIVELIRWLRKNWLMATMNVNTKIHHEQSIALQKAFQEKEDERLAEVKAARKKKVAKKKKNL